MTCQPPSFMYAFIPSFIHFPYYLPTNTSFSASSLFLIFSFLTLPFLFSFLPLSPILSSFFVCSLSLSSLSLSLALYLPLFLFSFLESLTLANVKTVNKSLTVCNHIKRYMTSPRSESGESVFTFMGSVSSHQLNGN